MAKLPYTDRSTGSSLPGRTMLPLMGERSPATNTASSSLIPSPVSKKTVRSSDCPGRVITHSPTPASSMGTVTVTLPKSQTAVAAASPGASFEIAMR